MADTKPPHAMPLPDAMAGNFQDAVRWFNQMWTAGADAAGAARGTGPIPSAMMPTLDIKELDKRIADLRSVEHWLKLNQGLVQTTIQGLEMQRSTLAAWQSFGTAAAGAAAGSSPVPPPGATAAAGDPMAFAPAAWWTALNSQFAQMAASAAAGQSPLGPDSAAASGATASPEAAGAASRPPAAKPAAGRPRGE